jgi:hypothetical protein
MSYSLQDFRSMLLKSRDNAPSGVCNFRERAGRLPPFFLTALCGQCGARASESFKVQGPALCALFALLACSLSHENASIDITRVCSFNLKSAFMKQDKLEYVRDVALDLEKDVSLGPLDTAADTLRWYTGLLLAQLGARDEGAFRRRLWRAGLIPVGAQHVCAACLRGSPAPQGEVDAEYFSDQEKVRCIKDCNRYVRIRSFLIIAAAMLDQLTGRKP